MGSKIVTRRFTDDLVLIRQIDFDTKYFEGLWEIPEGVVYNSYLLLTDGGVVVFDSVKKGYCSEYIDAVRGVVDLRDVKIIVSHHGEPDHSGCVKDLSDLSGATVVGHRLLGRELSGFYGLSRFKPVDDGELVTLGSYKLKFIHVPWLHWPETIVSYEVTKSYLFTCDVFGSYGVFDNEVFYDELQPRRREEYLASAKKYFANIIGFYRDWVVKNLDKLSSQGIEPKFILPAHGVCHREGSIQLILDLYRKWGSGVNDRGKVVALYTSMYGFVEETIGGLIKELNGRGVAVKVFPFNDKYRSNVSDFIGEAYDSEAIIIATSAYDSTVFPLAKLVVDLLVRKIPSNKKVVVIGLNGWGTKVGKEVADSLIRKGFKTTIYDIQVGERGEFVKQIADELIET